MYYNTEEASALWFKHANTRLHRGMCVTVKMRETYAEYVHSQRRPQQFNDPHVAYVVSNAGRLIMQITLLHLPSPPISLS